MEGHCSGEHRIFIVDCVAVESQGKVFVLTACTACGKVEMKDFQVAPAHAPIRLLKEEKEK